MIKPPSYLAKRFQMTIAERSRAMREREREANGRYRSAPDKAIARAVHRSVFGDVSIPALRFQSNALQRR